jgi:preprotein translocase SecF subunit
MKFPFTLVPINTKIDFIGKRVIAFTFSIALTIFIAVLLFIKGLNLGIDFTGGIVIEIKALKEISISNLRELLSSSGYKGATIQNFGEKNTILIRIQPKHNIDQKKEVEELKSLLNSHLHNQIEFRKIDYVGPKVGKDLVIKGLSATFISLICMMVYIWFRFNWQYGLGAIIALFHDAFFTLGFYLFTGLEFDTYSIVAILTVIGYSINDSVVIFDRIRENLRKYKVKDVSDLINLSINETLSRTVMTVLTTIVACAALVLFGGEVIYGFSMAMLVGIAFGTYSSIYIAAPVLLYTNIKNKN